MTEAKNRLLFFVYHGTGHFNACFHAAKILAPYFDVYFAGVPFFQQYVNAQGFQYIPLKSLPFGTSLEWWQNHVTKRKPVYLNTVKDRWKDRLYHEREEELTNLLDRITPSVVLLDAQQSTDFIVLHQNLLKRGIKFALIHTMFPTDLIPGAPPMDSLAMPDDYEAIRKAHRRTWWKKFKIKVLQFIHYGITDDQIIRRRIKKNDIPPHFYRRTLSSFQFALTNLQAFVFAPRRLQFPSSVDPNHQYVGTFVDHSRIQHSDQGFLFHRHGLFDLIAEKGLKLIYCAFGSRSNQYEQKLVGLIQRIIEATKNKSYLLLISVNIDHRIILTAEHPHVFIYKQLPQMEVLERADIFINHGGLNSIKEGIDAGVPMLIFPTEEKTDTCGNASRVVYHHIGLRGDATTDTPSEIANKIDALLADNSFKKNIASINGNNDDADFISGICSLRALKH